MENFFSFTLVPVGHLSMPGPVNITFNDVVGENDENKTELLHWNPSKAFSYVLLILVLSSGF